MGASWPGTEAEMLARWTPKPGHAEQPVQGCDCCACVEDDEEDEGRGGYGGHVVGCPCAMCITLRARDGIEGFDP